MDSPGCPGDLGPDPGTCALLRREAGMLRRRHRHERFAPELYVGSLTGPRRWRTVPRHDGLDPGTRTDVVLGLLEELEATTDGRRGCPVDAWLARPGEVATQDGDLAWLAATTRALGVLGEGPGSFWVVTRTGWLDVRSGRRRTWRRLRL